MQVNERFRTVKPVFDWLQTVNRNFTRFSNEGTAQGMWLRIENIAYRKDLHSKSKHEVQLYPAKSTSCAVHSQPVGLLAYN